MTHVDMTRPVPRLGLNRAEVAIAIGVSVNTVDLMVEEGFLPKPRKWHTRKVWLVPEIVAAMADWPEDGFSTSKGKDADTNEWRASA
jgi:predicted DNA-binding transcriptional regulator AlpA